MSAGILLEAIKVLAERAKRPFEEDLSDNSSVL
jgi:hypothetical protein